MSAPLLYLTIYRDALDLGIDSFECQELKDLHKSFQQMITYLQLLPFLKEYQYTFQLNIYKKSSCKIVKDRVDNRKIFHGRQGFQLC
jgi:hypothetical protein